MEGFQNVSTLNYEGRPSCIAKVCMLVMSLLFSVCLLSLPCQSIVCLKSFKYRSHSLSVVGTIRHFGPLMVDSQLKSQFFDQFCKFKITDKINRQKSDKYWGQSVLLYFDMKITSRIQGNAIIECINRLRQLGIKISRWFFYSDFPYLLFPITW